jgi:hypothetical protein
LAVSNLIVKAHQLFPGKLSIMDQRVRGLSVSTALQDVDMRPARSVAAGLRELIVTDQPGEQTYVRK